MYRSSGTQRTFTFSAASLELLKTSIKGQLAEAKIATFLNAEGEQLLNASEKLPLAHSPLSTFKCLAALLWHHVTRARLPRLQDLERSIMVQVAVGLKARGLVPQSAFPGFSVVNPTAYLSIGEVTSSAPGTLAKLAHFVRDTIDHVDDDYLSKVLQLITSIPDVTKICTTGEVERCDAGFLVNSWARFLGDTKWDVVGTSSSVPEWGRKASGPIEGYALVMPRRNDKDADWEVLLGLREEDMECLLADDTFLGWVKRVVQ